jgi:hypothetical protein
VSDWDHFRQRRNAAEVIHVPVRCDQIVEAVTTSDVPKGVNDPPGIAVIVAGPTGVNQYRFTFRGHKQRRSTTHHINEVDLKRPARKGLARSRTVANTQRGQDTPKSAMDP